MVNKNTRPDEHCSHYGKNDILLLLLVLKLYVYLSLGNNTLTYENLVINKNYFVNKTHEN